MSLDVEEIKQRLFTSSEDLPEGAQRIALKEVHINKAPVLSPMNTLSDDAASEWQIDRNKIDAHLQMIQKTKGLAAKIRELFSGQRFDPETDPDVMLYDGFIPPSDRKVCDQVLMTEPTQLAALQDKFNDIRLPELLFRYRARNWPETLNTAENDRWQHYCQSRLNDEENSIGIDLKSFGQKLAAMSIDPSLDASQRAIVDALLDWPAELA